jgi:predicted acetyltransferase
MPELVRPSTDYLDSYRAAVLEFQAEKRDIHLDPDNLAVHIEVLLNRELFPLPGRMPESYYWLVEGTEFLGRISYRHELTPALRQFGGHIGYAVRPSQRRKGYATLALRLLLGKLRQSKSPPARVMLTCDEDNIASCKVIQANGGELEDIIDVQGHPKRLMRWWIQVV